MKKHAAKRGLRVERFRVRPGQKVKLDRWPTDVPRFYDSEADAGAKLAEQVARTSELQDVLYASDRYALLLVFQAMDAAGKDGAIKHVLSGVNPQGCQVSSFKQPSTEELDHDFLWRTALRLPERGRIGIFNRSYYEEVLVVRVHPEYLAAQRLPGRRSGLEGILGTAPALDPRARGASAPQRHGDREVLPACIEGRAAPAFP